MHDSMPGKPVQVRHGPAAVTGYDASNIDVTVPKQGMGRRWRRLEAGSRKTDLPCLSCLSAAPTGYWDAANKNQPS